MNSCTLIVDGNWFLISRVMVRIDEFSSTYDEETLNRACDRLYSGMIQSLIGVLSKFTMVDNLVLASDDKSWRKNIIKPGFMDWSYKGNREFKDDTRWDLIFGVLKRLIDKCDDLGVTTYKASGAEGDDTIMYTTKWLNSKGVNTIIWSTDADLQQLLSATKACNVIYNGKNIVVHEDLKPKEMSDTDFLESMFSISPARNLLQQLEQLGFNLTYANPETVTMYKIVCGDASDNIKSIVQVMDEKSGRTYSATPKMLGKILEDHHIQTLKDFFDNRDVIIAELLKLKRFKGQIRSFDQIINLFEYNKKIIWLNLNNIPVSVYENLKELPSQYVIVKDIRMLINSLEDTPDPILEILPDIF